VKRPSATAVSTISESTGAGVAVGSGIAVGSGMAVGAGVAAGAQAARANARTKSTDKANFVRFIFVSL
jgi:hypothetical protein